MKVKNGQDLGIYLEASKKEGFCVLHHGKDQKWSRIFEKPLKKLSKLPHHLEHLNTAIGYLAYPNPKLKNHILDQKFYIFRNSKKLFYKKQDKIYNNIGHYRTSGKLEISIKKLEYIKKIEEIKELLKAGEIYQLNYAIRFRKQFEGEPYSLFLRLIESNPSAFSAFINCGNYQIISNSPECLFKVKDRKIFTQPIKGTARKTENFKFKKLTSKLDPNLKALLESEKERAELDMITDLARNDIGKICKYGSLKLSKNREVMELSNLWHTYSEVKGELNESTSLDNVIKALFPGGSITGCPKKRAMEYIEKLERMPRNIFTGSIGYIQSLSENDIKAEFSICIRTALIKDGYIEYWAGGGIVADSNPAEEYAECLLKAEKFLSLL